MAIRYFQFVSWEKWYPRKEYKSMPWVKMSTKFFEDPKLDGLCGHEKLAIIWLITECGRQNLGSGQVRVDEDSMRTHVGLRYYSRCTQILNTVLRKGVIIEQTTISEHGSSKQELRVKNKKKNPPNPLEQGEEIGNISKLIKHGIGNKDLNEEAF